MQGDVIAITNDAGTVVAKYVYDAWGQCTITADTSGAGIANINPFRYRSYYYDTEIGLYYLQSRYYDAETGRFVNGDESTMLFLKNYYSLYNFYNVITIALSTVAIAVTIWGYNTDCRLLNSRRRYISSATYNSIKKKIDLVFYSSLCAYIISIILSFMGWVGKLLKKTAIQVVAVFLGVVLGFTTSVVAWILDLGYTLSYNSLKKKMGVSV